MKERIFLLLVLLGVFSVCQTQRPSDSYSGYTRNGRKQQQHYQREGYNYACVNAIAIANRAFYQLANNIKQQIHQDVVYSDLDSIYGLSYYLDSTCSQDDLVLTVQGDENPACRRFFKLVKLALNQHQVEAFINDYAKGINLSFQALKIGKDLTNDCKVKFVETGEYDVDLAGYFDDGDLLNQNIDKEITRNSKYYAPDDNLLGEDIGDDDFPSSFLNKNYKKPIETVGTIDVSPSPKRGVTKNQGKTVPPKSSASASGNIKTNTNTGFLPPQNSPSTVTKTDQSEVVPTPTNPTTPASSAGGFGQGNSFMGGGNSYMTGGNSYMGGGGDSASGAGTGAGGQFDYSKYWSGGGGGDPSAYDKYIDGSSEETKKDPSLLAAYHQNLAKTKNEEATAKYGGNQTQGGGQQDYSSIWKKFAGNYSDYSNYTAANYGNYTTNYGNYTNQDYSYQNGEDVEFDNDHEEEETQDDDDDNSSDNSDEKNIKEIDDFEDKISIYF